MSFKPSDLGIPERGEVNIEDLIQVVRQGPSTNQGRRYKAPNS